MLVVDDDDVDREMIRRVVARSNLEFTLDEAESETIAFDRLRRSSYDCLLLDYHLQQVSGIEALPALREGAANPHLPVVMLTGAGDEQVAVQAMQHGVHDYLNKSKLSPLGLRHAIENAVQKADLQREIAEAHDKLEHLSLYDSLTGLPNRQLFFDRLEQMVLFATRSREPFTVLMMDLDLFKDVNDQLGHEAGDRLLEQVGERLAHVVRRSDTVARLGGDEFAAILTTAHSIEGAIIVAEKLSDVIAEPVPIGDQLVTVGLSTGIAVYPDHGGDGQSLLRHADEAMYRAKRGSLNHAVYSNDIGGEPTSRAVLFATDLSKAVDRDEFELQYQPKVELVTGKLTGVEALVRWRHPELGLLPPMEFIPSAERSSVILPLTLNVLEKALTQIICWRSDGIAVQMAVNLSARLLDLDELPKLIFDRLGRVGVEADNLTLEVTETGIMANPGGAAEILNRLSQAGVRISIDDFGTGYTSLKHLRELPISEIKIDRLFIQELTNGSRDATIVRSIVELGRGFGVRVVSEGIETEAVREELIAIGCDQGQGYLFSRPMDAADFVNWQRHPARMPSSLCGKPFPLSQSRVCASDMPANMAANVRPT